jgi:YHS domain-containing protein
LKRNPIQKRGIEMIRHLSKTTKLAILTALVALAVIISANTGLAIDAINSTFFGVAIKGYDTVAYHTEGRAVKGKSKFSHKWNDSKWYFSSAANRDQFAADPERFAPQYGGY